MSFRNTVKPFTFLIAGISISIAAGNTDLKARAGSIETAVGATVISQQKGHKHACATETLWDNSFTGANLGMWYAVKYTGMPQGQQMCLHADDFSVPENEIWQIDQISVSLYRYGRTPDSFIGRIYENATWSPGDSPIHEFQFTAGMPNELTIYRIDINVQQSNISLSPGQFWLSMTSVYENATLDADTCATAWLRKEIAIGDFTVNCSDSLGLFYGAANIPTPWWPVWFTASGETHSVWFTLNGSKSTAIKKVAHQQHGVMVCQPVHTNELVFNLGKMRAQEITLHDINGKLLKIIRDSNGIVSIDKRPFAKGVYLYKVTGVTGKTIASGKFSILR